MEDLTLVLPRLVAGRDFADDLVDGLGDVRGRRVDVDASRLLSGTPSFASQLVERVLVSGAAESLLLTGAPADFADTLTSAAVQAGTAERVTVVPPLAVAG